MPRNCSLCENEIPAARLKAVPKTQLCVTCKSSNDEPRLNINAPILAGVIAEGYLGETDEKQAESREIGRLLK